MENVPFMDDLLLFTSEEWWFSIAMLNSHRVHGLLRMACAAKHVRHISSQCRAAVVIVISVHDCLPGHDVILRHQLQHFAEHSMDLFVCCFRPAIENNHSMTGAENAWLASWSAKDRLKDVPKSAKPLGRSAMACLPGWLLSKAPSSSSLRCAPPKSISDLLQGWPGWGSAKCSRFFLHLRVATLSSQLSTTSYPHGLDRANALVLKLLIILHRRGNKKNPASFGVPTFRDSILGKLWKPFFAGYNKAKDVQELQRWRWREQGNIIIPDFYNAISMYGCLSVDLLLISIVKLRRLIQMSGWKRYIPTYCFHLFQLLSNSNVLLEQKSQRSVCGFVWKLGTPKSIH